MQNRLTTTRVQLPAILEAKAQTPFVQREIISLRRRSLIMLTLVFGVGGGWAAFANISGAVIGSGLVIVETNSRSVQHLTGGIVEKLPVREGASVEAGELLIKLDETQLRAQQQILVAQIDELLIRQARLDAERSGVSELVVPAILTGRTGDGALQRVIMLERIVLDSRVRAFDGQRAQLTERIRQISLEGRGLDDQLKARERQAELITAELKDLEVLFARNLVPLQRVSGLRREQSRLQGDVGYLTSEIAKTQARIAETELQIIQIEQQRRSEVTQDARDTASKLAEAQERRIAIDDQISRVELRSPSAGVVHQLAVFTVGGIVRPGETLMRIVPRNEDLTFEVRIAPRDIDQVGVGQRASIRLAAASQSTLLNIEGEVTQVSPDIAVDSTQPQMPRFFVARVRANSGELQKRGVPKLQPGMPAEIFIKTDERSPISYLVRPLYDQALRAFRER